MAKLIVTQDEEILRRKSAPVEVFDARLHQLLDDMLETMTALGGVGLAAPQVGVLRRACIVEIPQGALELVNPEILDSRKRKNGEEGCLSIPGVFHKVMRPQVVFVRAQDRHGEFFEAELHGMPAICVCHEVDHLNGVLFTDLVKK